MFFDTHTHLTLPEFQDDLEAVIERAQIAGVEKMIVPAIDLNSSMQALALAEKYAAVFAAVGVHPQDVQTFENAQLEEFHQLAQHPKVVAIGEIGLDYYRRFAPPEMQKRVLRFFLELADETGLPVILHNRAAFTDLLQLVTRPEYRAVRGVFHCFSEDVLAADQVVRLGFVLSFTGTITFKNSSAAEIAQKIAMNQQLLETDAPFMAPVPHRGKRNEPAFVKLIAAKQAEVHGITVAEVGRITSGLALRIFPRLQTKRDEDHSIGLS